MKSLLIRNSGQFKHLFRVSSNHSQRVILLNTLAYIYELHTPAIAKILHNTL